MTGRADKERLAILVHEVRSPVAALAAIRQAFGGEAGAGDRPELVALAVAACRAIERIVQDVAVASIRAEDVDLVRVVREAGASARLVASPVRVDARPDAITVRADSLRVRQVLDNLLANAVASSPPGAEITVRVRADGERVEISVSDSGPGIALADQGRIFDAGVRLDDSRSGSGLGLAISRAIAETHGGTLDVVSAPGEGATFTLVLPLRAS